MKKIIPILAAILMGGYDLPVSTYSMIPAIKRNRIDSK